MGQAKHSLREDSLDKGTWEYSGQCWAEFIPDTQLIGLRETADSITRKGVILKMHFRQARVVFRPDENAVIEFYIHDDTYYVTRDVIVQITHPGGVFFRHQKYKQLIQLHGSKNQ